MHPAQSFRLRVQAKQFTFSSVFLGATEIIINFTLSDIVFHKEGNSSGKIVLKFMVRECITRKVCWHLMAGHTSYSDGYLKYHY